MLFQLRYSRRLIVETMLQPIFGSGAAVTIRKHSAGVGLLLSTSSCQSTLYSIMQNKTARAAILVLCASNFP
jgi:hypothetical protein